jgi:hypothetical protein
MPTFFSSNGPYVLVDVESRLSWDEPIEGARDSSLEMLAVELTIDPEDGLEPPVYSVEREVVVEQDLGGRVRSGEESGGLHRQPLAE